MTSAYERRRAASRDSIRSQIVHAARRLVVELGMPNVSMSAVAKAAGISRQTLYNHFDDLEQIVLSGARQAVDEAADRLGAVLEQAPDPATALDWYVRGTIGQMASDDLAMGAAGGMSKQAEGEALEILERFHAPLNQLLHAGLEAGVFRSDLDPDRSSEVLFHMIGSARMVVAHGRDPEEVAGEVADLVLHAVRSRT